MEGPEKPPPQENPSGSDGIERAEEKPSATPEPRQRPDWLVGPDEGAAAERSRVVAEGGGPRIRVIGEALSRSPEFENGFFAEAPPAKVGVPPPPPPTEPRPKPKPVANAASSGPTPTDAPRNDHPSLVINPIPNSPPPPPRFDKWSDTIADQIESGPWSEAPTNKPEAAEPPSGFLNDLPVEGRAKRSSTAEPDAPRVQPKTFRYTEDDEPSPKAGRGTIQAAIERLTRHRPTQFVALIVVLVSIVAMTQLSANGTPLTSISKIRRSPLRFDGVEVTVRGRVGDVFPVGDGYLYNLHQGRDTIVVYSRGGVPKSHQTATVTGSISMGYLEGTPRPALFQTQAR
jgi:hypothetical protein